MIPPITFGGTFYNLDTYSLAFDAVERPGGIASEDLEMFRHQLKQRYGSHLSIECDIYDNPAVLSIDGHPDCVSAADSFVMDTLDRKAVNYAYQPAVIHHDPARDMDQRPKFVFSRY